MDDYKRENLIEYADMRIKDINNYIDFNERRGEKDFFANKELELFTVARNTLKIEEELGCPIDVLFKALMNKEIYFFTDKLECSKNLHCYISLDTNTCLENEMCINICIDEPNNCREEDVYLYLKDYKKSWWLKEEKSE